MLRVFLGRGVEAFDVPLLGVRAIGHVARDQRVDHVVTHLGDGLVDVLGIHQVDALLEDDLALVIHHVVVLEDVLADVEVARLDAGLGALDGLGDPRDG